VTSQLSDLTLTLFDTDGSTQLDLQNVNGLGGTESILGFSLSTAGTYYARITGAHNNIQLYQLDVSVMSAFLAGDFNMDGLFDCADIDSLVNEVASGTHTASFDLTGDGLVDPADVTEWLSLAGAANLASGNPYLPGDANLDGSVDGSDFNIWNSNKFSAVAAWCSGDFSADGSVDGSDFNVWNSNKFTSSDGVSVVPEPLMAGWLTCWGLLAIASRFKSSRQR
jgi:hypothetical protein